MSAALSGLCPRSPRTGRRALRTGLHAPLRRARGRTLELRCRPDELALADHAVVRLARALDLIEELAVVIRQLAHDLIFGRGGGSLVKSGNEVDFLANAEFVCTHTSREQKRSDPSPYLVATKLPRSIKALACLVARWLKAPRRHGFEQESPPIWVFERLVEENGAVCSCALQHFAPCRERGNGRPDRGAGNGPLSLRFLRQAFVDPCDVDHHTLVRPASDFLALVARGHVEFEPPSVDFGHFGLRPDLMPHRGWGEVADVDPRSDRALARVEKAPHGVERGVLHHENHDRGGEHVGQHRILEPAGEVLRPHPQGEAAFGAYRNRTHAFLANLGFPRPDRPLRQRSGFFDQNPMTGWCVCSTSGAAAKQWATRLRHAWKSSEPLKSTVWFSSVSHFTNNR